MLCIATNVLLQRTMRSAMTRLLTIWKRIPAVLMDGCASRPLGPERSKSHVDGQRLVVVDRDWDPVFADDACGLCSGRESAGILLSQPPSTVAAACTLHIFGAGAAV